MTLGWKWVGREMGYRVADVTPGPPRRSARAQRRARRPAAILSTASIGKYVLILDRCRIGHGGISWGRFRVNHEES